MLSAQVLHLVRVEAQGFGGASLHAPGSFDCLDEELPLEPGHGLGEGKSV